MGHREDLLAGAVRCLREKGYARTTARDIVAASGTNLASIGYHYGSTQALLNAAVFQAMEDFGTEIGRVMRADADRGGPALERFERFWAHVIDSFRANPGVWAATFDVYGVAQRDPQVRAAVAQGIDDGRALWARALSGLDPGSDDQGVARAVGSLHQALLSGVLVQWLIDPDRAPSAADLAAALLTIAGQVCADQAMRRGDPGPDEETDAPKPLQASGRRKRTSLAGRAEVTWNLLEPSVGPAAAEAAAAGWAVLVKEAVANGRLTPAGGPPGPPAAVAAARGVTEDAIALAAALAQPWAPVVLSGAVTRTQLDENLTALTVGQLPALGLAEAPDAYWAERAARPWH